jgi:hypothetical protein
VAFGQLLISIFLCVLFGDNPPQSIRRPTAPLSIRGAFIGKISSKGGERRFPSRAGVVEDGGVGGRQHAIAGEGVGEIVPKELIIRLITPVEPLCVIEVDQHQRHQRDAIAKRYGNYEALKRVTPNVHY